MLRVIIIMLHRFIINDLFIKIYQSPYKKDYHSNMQEDFNIKSEEQQKCLSKIIFESETIKNISISNIILEVEETTQKNRVAQKIQANRDKNMFQTFFTSTDFPNLQSIKISVSELRKLPKINAPLLNSFVMICIKELSLDQFAASNFQSLKSLKIIANSMIYLPKFNAPKLQTIQINSNFKNLIITDFFEGNYPSLQQIRFHSNIIDKLPKLIYSPKLSKISIWSNQINSLTQFAAGKYPSLKKINANHNKIKELPQSLNLLSIQELFFSNNQIETLDLFSNRNYPNLKIIDFSQNKIKKVPSIDAINLQLLDLSLNLIRQISNLAKFKYEKLEQVNLSGNKLAKIPFLNAPMLRQLDVENNKIKDFDQFYSGSLSKYQNLQIFKCDRNSIRQIPVFLTLKNYISLKLLSLRDCKITSIEVLSQIQLISIQQIDFSGNQIVSFDSFSKLILPKIKYLLFFGNLSYAKSSMQRCCFSNNKMIRLDKKLIVQQDCHDHDSRSMNWIIKNFKKVKISLKEYDYSKIIDLKSTLVKKLKYLNLILEQEYL